jgi:hypothetical protein
MKTKIDYLFWGFMLILAGGLALADQQAWIDIEAFSPRFWMLAFGVAGAIFLFRYLIAGLRFWGWLFPACAFVAVAGMIWLGDSGYRDAWIAAPIFGAIAVPFLVAFTVDFRKNWWALIPAFTFLIMGLVIVFGDRLPGEVVGASMMFAIAVPFAVVYFVNRQNWWALIPAFTMAVFGCIILLSMVTGQWVGAFITLAIAAPFFYVYFKYPQYWWALIPAGVMASIGVNTLLTTSALGWFGRSSFPSAILFLGWAATFGWLWRQRQVQPTAWARIPAMIAGIVAIVLLATGAMTEFGLVAVLIAGGLVLVYFGLRPRKESAAE